MTHRILVADDLHEKGIRTLQDRPSFQVDVKTDLNREGLRAVIGEYDALVIRRETEVDADILRTGARLKVVARAGGGIENVDVAEATRRGILVMNTPGVNSVATAEHTIGLILAVHRHIAQAVASMKEGKWEKKKFQGREIAGKILGVIGLGRVGGIVARLASQGLKMKVLGCDPATSSEAAAKMGAELTTLEDILSRSDVITVHVPKTDSTKGLIGAKAFEMMKPGVVIVNSARGGIIDEDALLKALEAEKVAAAGLDAFASEPPGVGPLIKHPGVVATPQLGASTDEADVNVAVVIAEQVIDYLEKAIVRNAVNAPVIAAVDIPRIRPYEDLARRMGRFLADLTPVKETEIAAVHMEYRGEVARWDFKSITNAALVGLMSRYTEDVNPVNASLMVQNRGIIVSETALEDAKDFGSSIAITASYAGSASRTVHGALIHRMGDEPRIVGIDDFVTEAVPRGPMVIVRNQDIPGMVAGITRTLAERGINIAQMNLSRDKPGGSALCIINIDQPADGQTLKSIQDIGGILSVRQVVLDS
ncbi:MAG: phosphoglycerate dehydrogenase [Deltaproteobacteria bacterium]|nr:phosphoglycerate dehydrogenase [Deltaproteobacteria bacterium]